MLTWLTDYQILFRNTDKSMKKLLSTAENYLLNFWIIVTRQLKLTEFSENRVVLQNISEIQMTWLTQGCVWRLNTITKNLLGIFTGYFEWEWSNRLSCWLAACFDYWNSREFYRMLLIRKLTFCQKVIST